MYVATYIAMNQVSILYISNSVPLGSWPESDQGLDITVVIIIQVVGIRVIQW